MQAGKMFWELCFGNNIEYIFVWRINFTCEIFGGKQCSVRG